MKKSEKQATITAPANPASDYLGHNPENATVTHANPQPMATLIPNTTHDWQTYLFPDKESFAELVIDDEVFEITLQDALIDGYLYGLHQLRAVEPIMFAPSGRGRLEYMVTDVYIVKEAYYLPMFDEAEHYLRYDVIPTSADELTDTFIKGYLLAHHKTKRYSRCLFTEGHEQRNQIVTELSSYETKALDAFHAQARISSRLRPDKPAFKGINSHRKADADGNPTDENGNPL